MSDLLIFTPADMLELHDPDTGSIGDCFRAVVATLVGLPVTEVPHFVRIGDEAGDTAEEGMVWWDTLLDWLHVHGLWIVHCDEAPPRPHLASGPAIRGVQHVVAVDADGSVHDPHPSRDGLLSVNWRAEIIPQSSLEDVDE